MGASPEPSTSACESRWWLDWHPLSYEEWTRRDMSTPMSKEAESKINSGELPARGDQVWRWKKVKRALKQGRNRGSTSCTQGTLSIPKVCYGWTSRARLRRVDRQMLNVPCHLAHHHKLKPS